MFSPKSPQLGSTPRICYHGLQSQLLDMWVGVGFWMPHSTCFQLSGSAQQCALGLPWSQNAARLAKRTMSFYTQQIAHGRAELERCCVPLASRISQRRHGADNVQRLRGESPRQESPSSQSVKRSAELRPVGFVAPPSFERRCDKVSVRSGRECLRKNAEQRSSSGSEATCRVFLGVVRNITVMTRGPA